MYRRPPRICLVHDYLNQSGGAEQVLAALTRAFPGAPVYTTIVDRSSLLPELQDVPIHFSFAQHLPGILHHHRAYVPVYPFAVASLDLRGFDIIVSSSSAFAKGCRVPSGALHISYCHTPMRAAWQFDDYVSREQLGPLRKVAAAVVMAALRRWDLRTARRVDRFIANSTVVRGRIERIYHRTADIIFPPVNLNRYAPSPTGRHSRYLVVSRLVAYKRIDLALEACAQRGLSLDVVGHGPDARRLAALAGPSIRFHGRLPTSTVVEMMQRARALIFPGEEDFGIVPVEATACGCPVVAFRGGGALDTIKEGLNGVFFDDPTPESLGIALARVDAYRWSVNDMTEHVRQFDVSRFVQSVRAYVRAEWNGPLD